MTPSLADAVVGRLLDGRYRVLSHIADGGMATVYLALDERLDREVAVKVMRDSLAGDEAFVSRFRREARSAARLSHPNVVAVYDQGEDGGDMFLTMEYVPGRTLRDVLVSEGPLTPRAALDVLDSVLQALAAAHSSGLIHRDVKPENVILRDDGVVKVADFGLARAVTTSTTTNASGTLLGTVAYLAPEQVERGVADARADVYAAGLLLYEMVTGRKAFEGDSPIHVAYQHVHGSVPVPSQTAPSVPAEVDALVALATARDPDRRPSDAGEYLREVRRSRQLLTTAELDVRPRASGRQTAAVTTPTRVGPDVAPTTIVADRASHDANAGRGRSSRRWPVVLVVVLLLAAAGTGVWWLQAGPGSVTRVPEVVRLTLDQARSALSQSGLETQASEAYDEQVAPGVVMAADPGAGSEVRRRSTVSLTVSKGPERHAAPTLVGTAADSVAGALAAAHLTLAGRQDAYSETVPAGTVIAQDPAAGTSLKPGAPVSVTVSKGRQPIPVPDLTGKPADQAQQVLGDAGLKVVLGTPVNSDTVPAGSVVSQTPASGSLFKGDQVTLVVSKGPVLLPVPATVGKQKDEAVRILKAAGFQVDVNLVLGGFFNTVRASDPAAGTMARKGSTVTITIV